MGANDYINKFRMEQAMILITSTEMSFTEIAEKWDSRRPAISVPLSNSTREKPRPNIRRNIKRNSQRRLINKTPDI